MCWLVASSSDGMRLAAAAERDIWTSIDRGGSWKRRTNITLGKEEYWAALASSADGLRLAAAVPVYYGSNSDVGIYTTSDGGTTWTRRGNTGQKYDRSLYRPLSLASSDDGMRLAAASSTSGGIYTSTDGGVSWMRQENSAGRAYSTVVMSSDGSRLAATPSANDFIYTSNDSGRTWVQQTGSPNGYWRALASSADGLKLVAVSTDIGDDHLGLYTSTDGGATWVKRAVERFNADAVASSAKGIRLVAVGLTTPVFTSDDSGATWVQQPVRPFPYGPNAVWALASSADGSRLVAGSWDAVYTSNDGGVSWERS